MKWTDVSAGVMKKLGHVVHDLGGYLPENIVPNANYFVVNEENTLEPVPDFSLPDNSFWLMGELVEKGYEISFNWSKDYGTEVRLTWKGEDGWEIDAARGETLQGALVKAFIKSDKEFEILEVSHEPDEFDEKAVTLENTFNVDNI